MSYVIEIEKFIHKLFKYILYMDLWIYQICWQGGIHNRALFVNVEKGCCMTLHESGRLA